MNKGAISLTCLLAMACTQKPEQIAEKPPETVNLPLLPLVPVMSPETYRPFSQVGALGGSIRSAWTNNSRDAGVAPDARGFAVCVVGAGVNYRFETIGGVPTALASVNLQGHLGRCEFLSSSFYYLKEVNLPVVDFGARDTVAYALTDSHGFQPVESCDGARRCTPLTVNLPAVERALGGLKLGPTQSKVLLDALTSADATLTTTTY